MSTVAVLGEGAWGTAISTLLVSNGHTVFLWCHDPKVQETIEATRVNERYLPGIHLSKKIIPVVNINEAIMQGTIVFETTPIKYLRSVLTKIPAQDVANKPWVVLSKGIEKESLLVGSEILRDVLGKDIEYSVCFGPSFAHELAQKHYTGVMVASDEPNRAQKIQEVLENSYFKTFYCSDPYGVQLCGALKNVIALCIGMLAGAGYGQNTGAFIITRGLQEMAVLVEAYGGKKETVYDLAGMGDLILTALSKQSRNFQTGYLLGQGKKLSTILQETGMIPEGINTLESVRQLMQQKQLVLPILSGTYEVIFNDMHISDFFKLL